MQQNKNNEAGNVFLFILLGVVLFAGLVFTVSKGFQGQSTSALSERQAELAAATILDYGQKLERAVNRIRRNGISESDLCFAHDNISALNNGVYSAVAECSEPEHNVFDPQGGRVSYKPILEDWLDLSFAGGQGYGEWMFTMGTAVIGVGDGALNVATSSEILAYVNYLDIQICEIINDKLGISGIPDNGSSFAVFGPYSGNASASGQINIAALDGQRSGCFENSTAWNGYVYYHVLVERDS